MSAPIVPTSTLGGQNIGPEVLASIKQASARTGVSFEFLLAQAKRESQFQPDARNKKSSASGLYQFTSDTWLEMMAKYGAKYGHAELASNIKTGKDGSFAVEDPTVRASILELRKDPETAALMAAEYAKSNRRSLERALGRPAQAADLYLAHFLGPSGAVDFLRAHASDSSQTAADIVPASAKKNASVFYKRPTKTAKSVASVYAEVQGSIEKPMRQYAKLDLKNAAQTLMDQEKPADPSWGAKVNLVSSAVAAEPPASPTTALPQTTTSGLPAPGFAATPSTSKPSQPSHSVSQELPPPLAAAEEADNGLRGIYQTMRRRLFG